MKPITPRDLAAAAVQLSMLQFFPTDERTQRGIMLYLKRLCGHSDGLAWLCEQLITRVGKWTNLVDVRGIYCTRYKPADGIENFNCELQGYAPNDGEMRSVGAEGNLTLPRGEAAGLLASILPDGGNLAIKTIPAGRIVNQPISTEEEVQAS